MLSILLMRLITATCKCDGLVTGDVVVALSVLIRDSRNLVVTLLALCPSATSLPERTAGQMD